jgi:hypothetical protein
MLPWGRRTSVIAIVVLVTLGSVAPGVAVASAGETRAVDDSTADRTVASAMAQWAVATRHASLPQEAAAEIEWRARVVPGAPAPDGRAAAVDPVTGCRVIDSRGRYELTADVTNSTDSTCIDVRSSDVIIDGNGHTIDGVGAAGTVGVFANGTNGTLDNVSVRDLVVTDWADGVRFEDAADGRVERVVAERNGDGFDLVGSPGTAVSDVTVADSDAAGFRLDSSPGNRFTNVSVTDSGSQGFVFSGSGENRLSDVSAAGSGGSGFSFEVGSGGNTLTDVSAGDSGGSGFSFSSASGGNSLENATVEDSDGAGFSFLYATGGNTLTNVTVVDSGGDGVFVGLRGSGDNVFRDVTVRNSSRHGFSFNAGNTTFENVTARDNGLGGFEIFDAGNHTLTNVSAVDNGGIGFEFRNLVSDNRFTNVSARGNDDEGFLLADADRTALVGVSATGNGAGVVVSGSTAVEIDGGTVENNTADGVRLEGAPHTTIRGARLLDNGRDGLLAANGSDRTLVTGVTARGNARCGLSVVASKGVRVVDSGTEANGDSGLGVGITQSGRTATSRDVVLENTTALDNGEHGVELGGSAVGVTVGTTNASDNAVDGIHVGGADGVTMRDTTTLGNGRWALFAAGTSEVYSVDDLAIDGGGVSFTARSVAVRGVSAPSTAPPSGHAGVGIYVNATPTGPNPFFDVSVSYDQAAADAAGVNESTLRLWEFDGSTWTAVTGSTVDEAANTVSANVTGFSVFAPVGADGSEPEPTPTPAAAAAATGGSGGDGGPNEPPVAAFDVSTDAPEVDAAVRFDAADSSDPDGVIVSYEWDFDGDGDTDATGASAEVTHAYEAGGTFEASLTVVDSFGATNTTTRSVDVATGPTPTVTTTPTATTTPTETETPTPTATATDTVTPTGMGDSSRTPATTPFGSSFPWWLPGGLIVAGVALYVARRWRDGRR